MNLIITLLALAAIGGATVLLLGGLLVVMGLRWLVRCGLRRWRARKAARELRELEAGTCDGFTAAQIVRLVEECWDPSAHC